MAQKWYRKATVQAALAAGTLAFMAVVFGPIISPKIQQVPDLLIGWMQPAQPCQRTATVRLRYYEAEAATLTGAATIDNEHAGFFGNGFVSGYGQGEPGSTTTFGVEVPSTGEYRVELCYANGTRSAKTLTIYVNEDRIRKTHLPNGPRWNAWLTKMEFLPLRSGFNSVSYRKDPSDNGEVNLDFIAVEEK